MMKLTWRRETPLQNIAFIAMMGAVNGALSVMMSFLSLSVLFALIVLPCINALGIYLLKTKWVPIYAITCIAIPLIATCYDISTTLFYVIPSIASGLIYGLLNKLKTPVALTILICSLWTLGSTYLSIPIIKAIYEIDMIPSMLKTIGKEGSSIANALVPSILFTYSWAAISLNHLIMIFIHEKLEFQTMEYKFEAFLYPSLVFVFSYLSIRFAFISTSLCYMFFALCFFFSMFSSKDFVGKISYIQIITITVSLVLAFITFALLARLFTPGTEISLVTLFLDAVAITALSYKLNTMRSC